MLDAQATEIAFELELGAARRVEVAGSALPAEATSLRVVEDTAIDIAGIGRVRVRPAIRDRTTLQAAVTAAEAALAVALLAMDAADVAEAASLAAARSGIADQLKAAEAALKSETPGEAAVGLKPGLEALRNHKVARVRRQDISRQWLVIHGGCPHRAQGATLAGSSSRPPSPALCSIHGQRHPAARPGAVCDRSGCGWAVS